MLYNHRLRYMRTYVMPVCVCVWVCIVRVCMYCLSDSYGSVFKRNRHFNNWLKFRTNNRRILFHVAMYANDIIGRELDIVKLSSRTGVEPTTFRTAATDVDKDGHLLRLGHRVLFSLRT